MTPPIKSDAGIRMDPRISDEVNKVWEEILDYEYLIVEEACESLGGRGCRLVDIGCGSRGLLGRKGTRLADLQAHSVGVDIDRNDLARNRNVKYRTCASCYSLPFKTSSVDIIVCRWVFEHLETPDLAMREFARVLRKGGRLYIKTPNLWNYAMFLSRMTPTAFHNFFLTSTGKHENTPTFYHANTKRRLTELATRNEFTVQRLELRSYSYMYYSFNKELLLTMRGISRLVGKITDSMHLAILCVLEKT